MNLYSYIVRKDFGLAPNPYWGELTLNVCKPKIRFTAQVGDWIIGTGSKKVKQKDGGYKDYSGKLVYAMKIDKRMTMEEYDEYCKTHLTRKIPYITKTDWRKIVGDCIYDYTEKPLPRLRKVLHKEKHRETDLSGRCTLLSTHFYYFGDNPVQIPVEFSGVIRDGIGHLIEKDQAMVDGLTLWISKSFKQNQLYGEPQLKWKIDKGLTGECEISCDE